MTEPPPTRQPARRVNWISIIFGLIAVALFATALVMAWPLITGSNQPPRPEAEAGRLEAVHVTDALAAQGLTVQQGQGYVPIGVFTVPGQGTTVDGAPLYYFLFPDAETAATEVAAVDPARIGPSGTPVPGSVPVLFHHSNVVVALIDASDDVRSKVEQALAGLP